MSHYEALHGKGDGVAICAEVAKLADLLGAMWFAMSMPRKRPCRLSC
jgi:hypothetical protein